MACSARQVCEPFFQLVVAQLEDAGHPQLPCHLPLLLLSCHCSQPATHVELLDLLPNANEWYLKKTRSLIPEDRSLRFVHCLQPFQVNDFASQRLDSQQLARYCHKHIIHPIIGSLCTPTVAPVLDRNFAKGNNWRNAEDAYQYPPINIVFMDL